MRKRIDPARPTEPSVRVGAGSASNRDAGPPRARTQPLTVTITKTSDGRDDYVQITSLDQFSVNIVLISSEVTMKDAR
jgi:hypothetical protein